MRSRLRFGLFLVVAAASCRLVNPVAGGIPAGGAATARRIVLLSCDGLAAPRHQALLARGAYTDPDGFSAFVRGGLVVERALPVDPTLTAVSHAAVACGTTPSQTGIVSNRFHLPGTPITEGVSGFDQTIEAETLWESFRRQGKRVGSLTYPGCDGTSERRRADFGMTYVNRPFAAAETISPVDWAIVTSPGRASPGVVSFAPPRRATVVVALRGEALPASVSFALTAVDRRDDGIVAYDQLLVDDDDDPGNGVLARAAEGEWFPLQFQVAHADGGLRTVGAWCLLRRLGADLGLVRIYRGAFFAIEAYPRSFRELLERQVGFWPGPPDDRALEREMSGEEGLTVSDYLAQMRRFSEFFAACSKAAISGETFDLLLSYEPVIDEVEHTFLVTDRRQLAYTEQLTATAASAVDEAYRMVDRATGEVARALDLSRDALVVISDHGMTPVWELVHVNEVLRRAGLAQAVEREGRMQVAESSQMIAVASGGCAHLYVNLIGREPTGVVSLAMRDEVVQRAATALARLEVDGEPVVEAMFDRKHLRDVGLDHPNSGDLVVFVRPGFGTTGAIGGAVSEPSPAAGQHGHLARHKELAAIWLARGAGVERRERHEASLIEVAGFVSRLAAVDPPSGHLPAPKH